MNLTWFHPRWISVLLWLLACFLPAVTVGPAANPEPRSGAEALVFGMITLLSLEPCWLANPIWALSIVSSVKKPGSSSAAITAAFAVLLALTVVTVPGKTLGSEKWSFVHPVALGSGALFWIAALVVHAGWSVVEFLHPELRRTHRRGSIY